MNICVLTLKFALKSTYLVSIQYFRQMKTECHMILKTHYVTVFGDTRADPDPYTYVTFGDTLAAPPSIVTLPTTRMYVLF